jgi:hypothetical protein
MENRCSEIFSFAELRLLVYGVYNFSVLVSVVRQISWALFAPGRLQTCIREHVHDIEDRIDHVGHL